MTHNSNRPGLLASAICTWPAVPALPFHPRTGKVTLDLRTPPTFAMPDGGTMVMLLSSRDVVYIQTRRNGVIRPSLKVWPDGGDAVSRPLAPLVDELQSSAKVAMEQMPGSRAASACGNGALRSTGSRPSDAGALQPGWTPSDARTDATPS